MRDGRYLTARAAADRLGIALPTLYAYVSRGLVRSMPGEGKSRARRYDAEDIARLAEQKAARHDPSVATTRALDWGLPVLESALTLITPAGIWYRGEDALALARSATFEEVATLLWLASSGAERSTSAADLFASPHPATDAILARIAGCGDALGFAPRLQLALTLAPTYDLAAFDRTQPQRTGARIIRLLGAVVAQRADAALTLATTLQQAWCPADPAVREVLNAALILCADHELNASSFAARIVASTDAHLYHVVTAGFAALQGFRHGGYTALVAALFREIATPAQAHATVAARLQRGENIPGFGHRLYPDGDPRALLMLDLVRAARPNAPSLQLADALAAVAWEAFGKHPTIDLALVTLATALELPEDAPLALFALGRTAGWIAHAIEQYQTGHLLRPRATYRGRSPL